MQKSTIIYFIMGFISAVLMFLILYFSIVNPGTAWSLTIISALAAAVAAYSWYRSPNRLLAVARSNVQLNVETLVAFANGMLEFRGQIQDGSLHPDDIEHAKDHVVFLACKMSETVVGGLPAPSAKPGHIPGYVDLLDTPPAFRFAKVSAPAKQGSKTKMAPVPAPAVA